MPKTIPSVGRHAFLRIPVKLWQLLQRIVVGLVAVTARYLAGLVRYAKNAIPPNTSSVVGRFGGVLLLLIFSTVVFLHVQPTVYADKTLNFQARLLTSSGSIVPDGTYNVEFKLYDQSTGGTELWTETREFDSDPSGLHVEVRSGYLSVYLGDKTPFPSSIDWNDQLYLTMNIGGTTAAPDYDGEMTPRIRLTAVPFAIQADRANLATELEDRQQDGTGTLRFDILTANRDILLPNASGTVALLQNAQTFTGAITFGASGTGLTVTNSASIGGNLAVDTNTFFVNASTNRVGIGTTSPGARLSVVGAADEVQMRIRGNGTQTNDLLQILNSSSTLLSGFDENGRLFLANSGFRATFETSTLTDDRIYTLPNIGGTLCLTSGNCSGVGGQVGGIGTAGRIAYFTGVSDIADSFISQDDDGVIIDLDKDLTVGSNTLFVDATNNRVGVGTATPDFLLDVQGGTGIVAQFSGRVIGGEAVNGDEFVTLDQLESAVGATGAYVQGGNEFGETAVLGTTDNYGLQFITNNEVRLTVADTGDIAIANALSVGGQLTVTTGGADITGNVLITGELTVTGVSTLEDTVTITGGGLDVTGTVTLQGNTEITDANTFTVGTGATTLGGTLTVEGTATFNNNVIIAAEQSIRLVGGDTASRPASPDEGTLYFDTQTSRLLVYADGKWQADRSSVSYIVAASDSPQRVKDAADFVANENTSAANDGAQVQINAALTAAGNAGGGTVYLTEGTFVIDAAVEIPNYVRLTGSGSNTIVTIPDNLSSENGTGNIDMITAIGSNRAGQWISDLKIDGNRPNQTTGTQRSIHFVSVGANQSSVSVTGARIENVWVVLSRGRSISLVGTSNSIIANNTIQSGTGNGIFMDLSTNNTVSNNVIRNNTENAIWLSASDGNTFVGNVLKNNIARGIRMSTSTNNSITSNIIENNSSGGLIALSTSEYNVITGNSFVNNGGSSSTGHSVEIQSSYNSILGNMFTDTEGEARAISLTSDATSTTLSNNRFGAGTEGVWDSNGPIGDAGTNTIYANQIGNNGAIINRQANSTEMFQLQAGNGDVLFNADTDNMRIGIGTDSPQYALDVVTSDDIAARFSGRVIGAEAVNNDEFITLGQANTLIGSANANAILQGGNAFDADITIGTTDEYGLNLITDGQTRLAISAVGNLSVAGDTFFVDAVNNRVQIGSDDAIDARLSVIGGADQTQLLVRAHSTQSLSNPMVLLQDSTGGELARLNATDSSLYLGYEAGGSTASGDNNIGIGASALGAVSTGAANTTLGSGALASVSIGSNNTAVGYNAGNLLTGSNNILLGYGAGSNLEDGSNNIIIGYNLGASSPTASDELRIGGIIQGNLDTLELEFNGDVTVAGELTINDGLVVTTGGIDITGASTIDGTLGVTGEATFDDGVTVTDGGIDVTGDSSFDGDITATGDATFTAETDSITTFRIQNAVGNTLFNADTTNMRIGIGTETPAYALDVVTADAIAARFSGRVIGADAVEDDEFATLGQLQSAVGAVNAFLQSGNAFGETAVLGTTDTEDISIITDNIERIRVTAAGRVGINTSAPSTQLHINQVSQSSDQGLLITEDDRTVQLYHRTGSNTDLVADTGSFNIFNTNSTGSLSIEASRNVTLSAGTGGPSSVGVRIETNGVERLRINRGGDITATGDATFTAETDSITTFRIQNAVGNTLFNADTTNMRIGIGTETPAYALDVVTADAIAARFSGRVIGQDAVEEDEFITLGQATSLLAGGAGQAFLQGGNDFGETAVLGTTDNEDLTFITNDIVRLTVEAGGNITVANALSVGGQLTVVGAGTFESTLEAQDALTVTTGGIDVTGDSSIDGALSGLTGLTSSGAITFSGLGAGVVQANASGVLSSSDLNLQTGPITDVLQLANGGTGASDSQGAINNISQLTAEGDLLYFDGTNSTRLARGNIGECLASTATSIEWLACSAGVTLQVVYDNSSPPHIILNDTQGGLQVRDAQTPISGDLFSVRNYDGDVTYLGVTTSGISVEGNITLGQSDDRTISVAARSSNNAGRSLTVAAGSAGSGAAAHSGGNLLLQGGDAAGTGNANGGNILLSGGAGVGTGSDGLVVISAPSFQTIAEASCAVDCTIPQASVDNNAAVIVSSTTENIFITIPDPTITTAGRAIYIVTDDASQDYELILNPGQPSEVVIAMQRNSTATLIWSGNDWTAAGASSSTTLQAAYNNTLTSAGGADIVLNNTATSAGLTIRNNADNPIIGTIFETQTSIGSNLFSVNNNAREFATNGGAETSGATSTSFPANTWGATPDGGSVSRYNTLDQNIATGRGSVLVDTSATAGQGAANRLSDALTPNLRYTVSYTVRGDVGFETLDTFYSPDGTNTGLVECDTNRTVTVGAWRRIICRFDAPASGITGDNAIFIRQSDAESRTFYVDNLSVTISADINHAADGSVENAGSFSANWEAAPAGGTVERDTNILFNTSASVRVDTDAVAGQGIQNNLSIQPQSETQYLVTFYARSDTTFDDIRVRYSPDGGSSFVSCVDYNTRSVSTFTWTRITCLFTTNATTATNGILVIDQPTATDRTFWVDALSVTLNSDTASNVQIGGGSFGGPTTLLTLDRSAGPPVADNNDAYLGSMYFDTTTGRIQCYEAGGWGTCGSPPDNIVNLNPEYAGSVLNGNGVGTMTADFCANESGVLDVNSDLCDEGQALNYYRWTSPQASEQTYSIYVTYQLPSTFDGFANDDTVQLTARRDNSNAEVSYEMFRSQDGEITRCGVGETVVTTSDNEWQTVGINGNEATGCGFTAASANSYVIFKINLKASVNANAYTSTLSFTTTGR